MVQMALGETIVLYLIVNSYVNDHAIIFQMVCCDSLHDLPFPCWGGYVKPPDCSDGRYVWKCAEGSSAITYAQ